MLHLYIRDLTIACAGDLATWLESNRTHQTFLFLPNPSWYLGNAAGQVLNLSLCPLNPLTYCFIQLFFEILDGQLHCLKDLINSPEDVDPSSIRD